MQSNQNSKIISWHFTLFLSLALKTDVIAPHNIGFVASVFLNFGLFFLQHRTTVTISDPEEEMNDVQMRLHTTRRRTSTRHRPHYHKYGRFPPVTVMVTPDNHSDTQSTATPSPNPSSELVRISTLWDIIILIPMNPSRLLLCLLSPDEESRRAENKELYCACLQNKTIRNLVQTRGQI